MAQRLVKVQHLIRQNQTLTKRILILEQKVKLMDISVKNVEESSKKLEARYDSHVHHYLQGGWITFKPHH